MADLIAECYGSLGNDGNDPYPDKFLGKVTISTLSSTSQQATLLTGTEYVKLSTDATVKVFYRFGTGTVTAVTTDQALNADLSENNIFVGKNKKENNVIAARIA
jgi:hypothetical protein